MIYEVKTTLHGGPCAGETVRVSVDGDRWPPHVMVTKRDLLLRQFDRYTAEEMRKPMPIHTYAAVRMRKDRREWCEYFYLPD